MTKFCNFRLFFAFFLRQLKIILESSQTSYSVFLRLWARFSSPNAFLKFKNFGFRPTLLTIAQYLLRFSWGEVYIKLFYTSFCAKACIWSFMKLRSLMFMFRTVDYFRFRFLNYKPQEMWKKVWKRRAQGSMKLFKLFATAIRIHTCVKLYLRNCAILKDQVITEQNNHLQVEQQLRRRRDFPRKKGKFLSTFLVMSSKVSKEKICL